VIQAAIFDWGGVLVHSNLHETLGRWDGRLGLSTGSVLQAMFAGTDSTVLVGRVSAEEHWRKVCSTLSLSESQHGELTAELDAAEVFDAQLGAFVAGLRHQLKTAILTNLWSDGRAAIRREHAEQLVDHVLISAEIGAAKPHRRAFEIALAQLGVGPREAIFVDDSEDNITAASALGLQAIRYENTPDAISSVRALLEDTGHL
jgi:putative hydrolase of the HAD superfamily